MNSKSIGFLIILIVFTTGFQEVQALKDRNISFKVDSKIIDMSLYDEMPLWEIGDSWTYYLEFTFSIDEEDAADISLHLSFDNLKFTIDSIDSNSYRMALNSNVDGDFFINFEGLPRISGIIKDTHMDGYALIEKDKLGMKEIYFVLDGKLTLNLIPIPLNIELTIKFDPSYVSLSFPISTGSEWYINESYVTFEGFIYLPGITKLFPNIPDEIPINEYLPIGGDTAICNSKEDIRISAGLFNVYNITFHDSISYYSPVAGNIIKLNLPEGDFDFFNFEFFFELTSTTFTVYGAPNKPSTPSGSTNGKPNNEYSYTTSATDNEGDKLSYFFDWGDDSYSAWIGVFNSGETVETSHIWLQEGTYFVRVKVKDEEEHESQWSDPLTVTIKKKKQYSNIYFSRFIQMHPRIFIKLRQIQQIYNVN